MWNRIQQKNVCNSTKKLVFFWACYIAIYYPQEPYERITAVQKEWTGCVILRDGLSSAADKLSAFTSVDNWSQAIWNWTSTESHIKKIKITKYWESQKRLRTALTAFVLALLLVISSVHLMNFCAASYFTVATLYLTIVTLLMISVNFSQLQLHFWQLQLYLSNFETLTIAISSYHTTVTFPKIVTLFLITVTIVIICKSLWIKCLLND